MNTRRQFLSHALAASAALPLASTYAQGTTARWTRRNLNDPKSSLESYKKAVAKMLSCAPEDPQNWYRNAFVHILDCPHHNWWFLPWHRGFIGWFELTCRKLSGDPDFALPYWDWTTEPSMPAQFYDSPLDPSGDLFLSSKEAFVTAFKDPASKLWASFTKPQLDVLAQRTMQLNNGQYVTMNSASNLWSLILDAYPDVAKRALSAGQALPTANYRSGYYVTAKQVTLALRPTVFQNTPQQLGFGSDPASQLSLGSGAALLEHGPHDNVHNDIGLVSPTEAISFMPQFLSPVDPIFFMHHCNLDRLWDVWTRKQQANGLPIFPTENAEAWFNEPFLFFIDPDGKPLSLTAKDSTQIGHFDYNYSPGFGEAIIKKSAPSPLLAGIHAADMNIKKSGTLMASGSLMLPSKATQAVAEGAPAELVARVTFAPGVVRPGTSFQVRVNSDKGESVLASDDPSVVAEIRPFGGGHDGPMSFMVPISEGLKRLNKANPLSAKEPLQLHVTGMKDGQSIDVKVQAITISSF